MSIAEALKTLANYRVHNTRASQEIVEKGNSLLNSKSAARLGDEAWTFLEQLALAAIDVGKYEIADECLKQLSTKFPESPRVDVLTGIRMEATEDPDIVLKFYNELLEADSANAAIWKRRISVLLRTGKVEKAVEELSAYLDTFYSDVEGWVQLAEIYISCYQYTFALQALSHALLLAPQNPFYVLQFAETAYTSNDLSLAVKMFLVVIDMSERDLAPDSIPAGVSVRAWYGLKLCCRRLLSESSSHSPSNTPLPKHLKLLDELATDKVMKAYSGSKKDAKGKDVVTSWVGSVS